jgi:hypothetical protein
LKNDSAVGTGLGDFEIVQGERTAVCFQQTGDERDQRGFAGTGVADDGDELAAFHVEVDVAEDLGAFGRGSEAFAHSV